MTRRTMGLISIVLVLVVGFGALIAVPAVRADTTAPASAEEKAATDAKLATLKTVGQKVREAAKAVQEKVKTAKAAGKDLSAFKAGIATALKGGRNLRFISRSAKLPRLCRRKSRPQKQPARIFRHSKRASRLLSRAAGICASMLRGCESHSLSQPNALS